MPNSNVVSLNGLLKQQGLKTENKSDEKTSGTVEFNSGHTFQREEHNDSPCLGFLNQHAPIDPLNERICKHLKDYYGKEFQKCREKASRPTLQKQPNCMSAQEYKEKVHDPVGWWMSEKLDGVRALWNGRCFYSRLGNAFKAPEWFIKDLPRDMHLDGELFGGRGQFQSTVSIVKTAESPRWEEIKYHVFDSPSMGKEVFENRMQKIKEYFETSKPKYAVIVKQVKCEGKDHIDKELTRVLNLGGEGLMIRKPKSVYKFCRSKTLLKIKKFYDAEAVVILHCREFDQIRCRSLRCRMACGIEFGIMLAYKDRYNPPKIGSIIQYKFQGLTRDGIPRFAVFHGVCIDKTEPKDAQIREVLDEDEA